MVEDDDVFGAYFESYCLPLFVRLFFICCLPSAYTHVDVTHSVLVVTSLVLARCEHMSIRHLLIISVHKFHKHISCTSLRTRFLSFTRSVSAILSLYAFILAFPVNVLSIIVLIRSRQSSLCVVLSLFRATPVLHNADNLQCDRQPQCLQTTRSILCAQPLESFQLQSQ